MRGILTGLTIVLLAGAGLLLYLTDGELITRPAASLESLAIRHADKLPLAYLGGRLFDRHCANCHDDPAMKAPGRSALSGMSREAIMIALEFGKMQPMATHLSKRQRGLIALHLADSAQGMYDWIDQHRCAQGRPEGDTPWVAGWGLGNDNRRFVGPRATGIGRGDVHRLELAWSFAFPRVTDMRSQPAIVGDTLYIGDKAGRLYALDRRTGCVRNHSEVLSGVRSGITVAQLTGGRRLLVFADSLASVFAVDPDTLDVVWQRSARLFDTSIVTGSITYHDGRLYVPVSSYEVAAAGGSDYVCCRSHGAVLALDAGDGHRLWEWHATGEAVRQGRNSAGLDRYGPSGAVVWTTPAVDDRRRRIYFGTGENLSHPATDTSDAIVALDMDTGALVWKFQATAGDVWNAACLNGGANCPDDAGPDFDFGASVIIADRPGGGQMLLAGQKSGEVYALDPDPAGPRGEVIWRRRLSQGTTNGGIHWGMSLSGQTLVVPVADPERERPGYQPRPGLYALDSDDGRVLWQAPVTRDCEFDYTHRPLAGLAQTRSGAGPDLATQYACSYYYGLSAAAVTTGELAFAGALDGRVRAWDLATGQVLWQARTAVPFEASNSVTGHGGAIDVSGVAIADGWLYVLSGYSLFGQLPGNMLLAYRVP